MADEFMNGFLAGQGENKGMFEGNGFWYIIIFALIFGWGGLGFGGNGNNSAGGQAGYDTRYAISSELAAQGLQEHISGINTSMLTGFNSLANQLQNCCCENRQAISDVRYDMATQFGGITNAMNLNTRDIIDAVNAGTHSVLDTMCADKITSLTAEKTALQNQLSQMAQNAVLTNAMTAQTDILLTRLNPNPIPAYVVQNPNCCSSGYTCGV